jgi:tetratricopeptide (TPR) repeat protein
MIVNAVIQQRQRNWADSRVTLQKALRLTPNDSTILCMIGRSAEELGKKGEAITFYEKAVDVNPKDTWANELLLRARGASSTAAKSGEPVASAAPVEAKPAEAKLPEPKPVTQAAESAAAAEPAAAPASASSASDAEPDAP